jgi:hypothetical protein
VNGFVDAVLLANSVKADCLAPIKEILVVPLTRQ